MKLQQKVALSNNEFQKNISKSRFAGKDAGGTIKPVASNLSTKNFASVPFHNKDGSDLPTKICIVCKRPFAWRKKWEKVWEQVKYCSKRCQGNKDK